jgi:hypothetical protein
VSDEELAPWLAEKDPSFLKDEEFKAYVDGLKPTDTMVPLGGKIGSPRVWEQKKKPFFDRADNKKSGELKPLSEDTAAQDKLFRPAQKEERHAEYKRTAQMAEEFRLKYDADREMIFNSATHKTEEERAQALSQLEADHAANIGGLGMSIVEDVGLEPYHAIVGEPVQMGGKVATAAVADLLALGFGDESQKANNLSTFANDPHATLPFWKDVEKKPWYWRWLQKGTVMSGEFAVLVGAMAAGGRGTLKTKGVDMSRPALRDPAGKARIPASTQQRIDSAHKWAHGTEQGIAVGAIGFDEEGNINPLGMAMVAGIPVVDKLGRTFGSNVVLKKLRDAGIKMERMESGKIVASIKGMLPKMSDKSMKVAVERAAKTAEFVSGAGATTAYLMALQTPGIMQAEDVGEAAENAILGAVLMSALSIPRLAREGSLTRRRLETEGHPINYDLVDHITGGTATTRKPAEAKPAEPTGPGPGALKPVEIPLPAEPKPRDVEVPKPPPPKPPEPAPEPPAAPKPEPPAEPPPGRELEPTPEAPVEKPQPLSARIGWRIGLMARPETDNQKLNQLENDINELVGNDPEMMALVTNMVDVQMSKEKSGDIYFATDVTDPAHDAVKREYRLHSDRYEEMQRELREALGEAEPLAEGEPPSTGDTFLPVSNPNVHKGDASFVMGAKASRQDSVYAWVPTSEIQPSHVGDGFAKNELYNPLRNTRDYSALASEKEKVLRTAKNWEPYSYTTLGPSAGDGPVMVSQGTDGVFRVLGGNGRFQSIQRLNADQLAKFGTVQNEMSRHFGLSSRPTDDHLLVRLLPSHDLAEAESIENANTVVDLLNPSEGMVEQTDVMAINDAGQVTPDALANLAAKETIKEQQAWFTKQIGEHGIDFNTRRAIVEDGARFGGYLKHLLAQGAFQNPALTRAYNEPKLPAVYREGLIGGSIPMALKLRAKGETALADALSEMVNGIVSLHKEAKGRDPVTKVFDNFFKQGQANESEELKLARSMAAALAQEVRFTAAGRVSMTDTVAEFSEFFGDVYKHISNHDPNALDMFQEQSVLEIVRDFIESRLGPDFIVRDPNDPSRYKVTPNPLVVRWNKLRKKENRGIKLTQPEIAEMRIIEEELGQEFFSFDNAQLLVESKLALENEKKADAKLKDSLKKTDKKDIASDLTTQHDMFTDGPGFTLFDGDHPVKVDSLDKFPDWFPGFENIENNAKLSKEPKPRPNEKVVRGDRQLQLGGLLDPPGAKRRIGKPPARPPKQIISARKHLAPNRANKPDHAAKLIPKQAKILRPHQIVEVNRAFDALTQGKDFAIFSGTGAGKTMVEISIAVAAIAKAKEVRRSLGLMGEPGISIEGAIPQPPLQPVLIVTESDGIINDAFARDSEMLGVELWRYRGGEIKPGQEILLATYTDIARGVVKPGGWQTVIFDEAHNLRNQGSSIQAHRGRKLAESADHAVFATATPLDKPHGIYYLNSILVNRSGDRISPELALLAVGLVKNETIVNGETRVTFTPAVDPKTGEEVTFDQIERNLERMFDNITRAGLAVKHEVPLDNIEIDFRTVQLSADQTATVEKIMQLAAEEYGSKGWPAGAVKRLVMMAGRQALESVKAVQAIKITKDTVAQGRQVVVFAQRVNVGRWGLDNGLETIFQSLNKDMPGEVGRLFGSAVNESARMAKQDTIEKFQEGIHKVVLATPETGGTGVSLDDLYGDAPRSVIVITPPFSALEFVQMAGRVNRLMTASKAEMHILHSGHQLDQWNSGIIMSKLKLLGASVKGEIADTEVGRVSQSPPVKYKSEAQVDFEALEAAVGVGTNSVVKEPAPQDRTAPSAQRVIARQVRQDISTPRGLEIAGRKINSINHAAEVFQVFRNASIETYRWVLMKEGKVVSVQSVTSRMPTSVAALPPGAASLEALVNSFKAHGADGFYMVHNHPSGDPKPSVKDGETTRALVSHPFLKPLFNGAVTIDHRKAAVLDWEGKWDGKIIETAGPEVDPLLGPEIAQPIGANVVKDVAAVGQNIMHGDGHVSLMYTTTTGHVRTLAELNLSTPLDEMVASIRREAREAGAAQGVAYFKGSLSPEKANLLDTLIEAGVLADVITGGATPTSRRASLGLPANDKWFGQQREQASLMVEDRPKPKITFSAAPIKKGGVPEVVKMELGGLDHISPVMLPELVALAKELVGELPKTRKLRGGTAGFFRHSALGGVEIHLDRSIFLDPATAAKVLAHEIGHLVDFLPDKHLKRGNILGRLASLTGFLKKTFPINPGGEGLNKGDRSALRRQAERENGTRPSGQPADMKLWQERVKERYSELVEKTIKSRGLAEADVIAQELIDLSAFWHPYNKEEVSPHYIKYRESGKELYADALSVMLNSPGLLQEQSPHFYKMFWNYIDAKPEVKEAFFGLQQFLNNGQFSVAKARSSKTAEAFEKGDAILARKLEEAELRRRSWKGYMLDVMQAFDDARYAAVQKVKEAIRNGADVPPNRDPRNFFEQESLVDNRNRRMMKLIHRKVVNELDEFGIDTNQFGEYLMLQRIVNERSGLANPMGLEPVSAQQQLLNMRLLMGFDRMTIMERAAKEFHEINLEIVREAVKVGAYNQRTFVEKILPNKDFYATFAVLDYLETYIPAGIKEQIGTLRDIANPMTATIIKLFSVNQLIAIQKSKNSFIDLMKKHFPTEITLVPTRRTAEGQTVVTKRPPPGFGHLMVLDNGRPAFYEVEEHIASGFENKTAGDLERALRPFDAMFRTGFYPFWITYNIAFQLSNLKRDFSRTRRNLNVGSVKLGKAYVKALGPAVRRSLGKNDPLVTELMENYAISDIELSAVSTMHSGEIAGQGYYEDMLKRYNMLPKDADHRKIIRKFKEAFKWLEFSGQVGESLPKLAAGVVFKDRGVSPKDFSIEIRNFVGTPNVYKKGSAIKVARAIVPFWNVFLKGWKSDYEKATDPKTRSGWWMRFSSGDGMWAMMMGAAAAGLLGSYLKELFDGVSDYDMANYNVLPIGLVADETSDFGKKVAYLRIPKDETSRLISGLMYIMSRGVSEAMQNGDPVEAMSSAATGLEFGGDQLPGFNPVLTLLHKWGEYVMQRNPKDGFGDRSVIPSREFSAGGLRGLDDMFIWSFGQTGLQDWFRYDADSMDGIEGKIRTFGGPMNRFVKISDYGYREIQRKIKGKEQERRDELYLEFSDPVRKLHREYFTLQSIGAPRGEGYMEGGPAIMGGRTENQNERYIELNRFIGLFNRAENDIEGAMTEVGRKAFRDRLDKEAEFYKK